MFGFSASIIPDCLAQDSLLMQIINEANMNRISSGVLSPQEGVFSKCGDIKSNVNLFGGDLNISVPIFMLTGRSGLDYSLALSYSSNIHPLINLENRYQQTSWVGAGWSLGHSSIRADFNGTACIEDDEYFLDGVRLIKKNVTGDYFVPENNPYKEVEMNKNFQNRIITWIVRNEDGTVFTYGLRLYNFLFHGYDSDACRYRPHWKNWIGDGRNSVHQDSIICYQWDRSAITDIFGNNIKFYYHQIKTELFDSTNNDIAEYIQASYLDSVIDAAGRKIEFIRENRDSSEWQDVKPDWQIEKYETKRLKEINVYEDANDSTSIFMTVNFQYNSSIGTGNKYKKLLTEIITKNADSDSLPSIKFEYYTDQDNSNTGALKRIIYPTGGTKNIIYNTEQQNNCLTQDPEDEEDDTDDRAHIFWADSATSDMYVHFRNSAKVFSYLDRDDGNLYIWRWDGRQWNCFEDTSVATTTGWEDYHLEVTDNHVVYYLNSSSKKLKMFSWDNKKNDWEVTIDTTLSNYNARIALSESLFGYAIGGDTLRLYFKYWNDNKRTWFNAGTINCLTSFTSSLVKLKIADCFALVYESIEYNKDSNLENIVMKLYRWNGKTSWSNPVLSEEYPNEEDQNKFKNLRYYLIKNGMFVYGKSGTHDAYLRLCHYDGNNFITDYDSESESLPFYYGLPDGSSINPRYYSHPVISSNHIALCEYSTGPKVHFHMWNRIADDWNKEDSTYLEIQGIEDDGPYYTAGLNDNFMVVLKWKRSSSACSQGPIYCYKWNKDSTYWEKCGDVYGSERILPDSDDLYGLLYYEEASIKVKCFPQLQINGDRVVLHYGNRDENCKTISWKWEGSQWSDPDTIFQNNYTSATNFYSYGSYKLFSGSNFIGSYRDRKGEVKVKLVHGKEEWDDTITDYPVKYIFEDDGYDSTALKLEYEFPSDSGYVTYDPALNIAGYDTAGVQLQGSYGFTKHTFNNDIVQGDSVANLKRGYPNQTVTYSESKSEVANQVKSYELYTDSCNSNVYAHRIRLICDSSTVDSITKITNYAYNDSNSQLSEITETNSDSTKRITRNIFAFEKYSNMLSWNMLTQVAQKTVYRKVVSDTSARSSNVTTWKKNWSGQLFWAPLSTYYWLDKNDNFTFTNFSSTNWANDTSPDTTEWIKTSKVLKRDGYGNIIEISDANGVVSSTEWGYDSAYPVSQIRNSNTKESSFLCFENKEINDGWDKGIGIVSDDYARTGTYSFRAFNDEDGLENFWHSVGSGKQNEYDSDQTYVATVWAYVINSDGIGIDIFGIEQYPTNNPDARQRAQATIVNEWELLTVMCDASQITGSDSMRVWASAYYADCNIYFDDLRVFPIDAVMTSKTYDIKMMNATSISDKCNIPVINQYDDFGRLLKTINVDGEILDSTYYFYSPRVSESYFDLDRPNYIKVIKAPYSNQPLISATFLDGLGREMQSQTRDDENDIITKTAYNEMGNIEKKYKPRKVLNENHDYLKYQLWPPSGNTETNTIYDSTGTITADSNTQIDSGSVEFRAGSTIRLKPGFSITDGADFRAKINPDTWLYEQSIYENNPLTRIKIKKHFGGEDTVVYNYGKGQFDSNPPDYRYKEIIDERQIATRNYFDKFGYLVASTMAFDTDEEMNWDQEYDILGNVIKVNPPNAYNVSYPGDWDIHYEYNTMNQMVNKETPDDSVTKYIYDNAGNLRFKQDIEQKKNGWFTVYRFDKLNRIVSIGEERDTLWTSSSEPDPASDYALSSNEWKIKHDYDINYVLDADNYCQGRLTKTLINDDTTNNTTDHIIKYVYDKFGNLTEKHIQIDLEASSTVTEKIIQYKYDLLGRETEIIYPSGKTELKTYDDTGLLKSVVIVP
jgi:YD repeat-containing protein